MYAQAPPAALTQGKYRAGYQKRDDTVFDPLGIVLDDGNSTRRISEDEVAAHLGWRKCATPDCRAERESKQAGAVLLDPRLKAPATSGDVKRDVEVPTPTLSLAGELLETAGAPAQVGSGARDALDKMPRATGR